MITLEPPEAARGVRQKSGRFIIREADESGREEVYELRHTVYAEELNQYVPNAARLLHDALDDYNIYLTAHCGDDLAGFVSITPPGHRFSIEKYCARSELPFELDEGTYEVRVLTVARPYRGRPVAALLLYAALRWIEQRGGRRVAAIGRLEILDLYLRLGLVSHGRRIHSGAVVYELMSADVSALRHRATDFDRIVERVRREADWRLDAPYEPPPVCYHGGAFFDAIGPGFESLDRSRDVINADVLDAWFAPSPRVVEALAEFLPWIIRTSPPTNCEGMIEAIARARGVQPENILAGSGSSDLIFLAFRTWLTASSRALILDPTYGEYAHVLERVIGCKVDRLALEREKNYDVDLDELRERLHRNYDLVALVNPNSPTGRLVPGSALFSVLAEAPESTRVWIDETYIEYAGSEHSLERFAARSGNIVVCKSMSKVYALSGVRAAYLCGRARTLDALRPLTPPWAVSLPGQIAAVKALEDAPYYAAQHRATRELREAFSAQLRALQPMEITPGVANFLLCHLPPGAPDAAAVVDRCRKENLFLRDASTMGTRFDDRTLRIAVKDAGTNRRMLEILARALKS
jgi:histidinol-phosphate/aromatic aminotransferase/cobyric acid decarboxylase-like protein/GNAT superfamily N-acetyltransferase